VLSCFLVISADAFLELHILIVINVLVWTVSTVRRLAVFDEENTDDDGLTLRGVVVLTLLS